MRLSPQAARTSAPAGDGRALRSPPIRAANALLASAEPLPLSELGPAELARWRQLANRAAEPNPFFEPEFVLPAARNLRARDVGLLVVRSRERDWLACMPVWPWLTRNGSRLRAPVLSDWGHPWYGCLGTPLVAQDAIQEGCERLLAAALKATRSLHVVPGLVALTGVGEDGPVAVALSQVETGDRHRLARHGSFRRAVLRRTTVSAGPIVSGRHRRDLRRIERRLADVLGGGLEVRDESERAAAVERFMVVEASGWKGSGDGDAFLRRPGHAGFFRELCDGFRAAGRLQLLAYGTAERTVSYKCNLLAGDGVFCFRIAFEDEFARYRPGLQLELRMIELFGAGMDQAFMDSCTVPGHPMFDQLWPDRRRIGAHLIAAGGAVGHGIGFATDAYRLARDLTS